MHFFWKYGDYSTEVKLCRRSRESTPRAGRGWGSDGHPGDVTDFDLRLWIEPDVETDACAPENEDAPRMVIAATRSDSARDAAAK